MAEIQQVLYVGLDTKGWGGEDTCAVGKIEEGALRCLHVADVKEDAFRDLLDALENLARAPERTTPASVCAALALMPPLARGLGHLMPNDGKWPRIVLAIDAPFGFPADAREHGGLPDCLSPKCPALPLRNKKGDEKENSYLYRRTEMYWTHTKPGSAVSNRLGSNATKAAVLVRALKAAFPDQVWIWPFPDPRFCTRGVWGSKCWNTPTLTVLETYPSAVLQAFGHSGKGYKGQRSTDDKLAAHVSRLRIALSLSPSSPEPCYPSAKAERDLTLLHVDDLIWRAARADSADELDAIVCMLVARWADFALDGDNCCDVPASAEHHRKAPKEGWIAVPRTARAMAWDKPRLERDDERQNGKLQRPARPDSRTSSRGRARASSRRDARGGDGGGAR